MGFLIFLFIFGALLVAWGLRSVPMGTQWLPVLFGKRLPYRLTEGLVLLPRWLFQYESYDIREEEFYILADHLPDGSKRETITTTNGVEAVIRGVVGYYTIAREDSKGKRSLLGFFGWQPGKLLLAYSQVHNQDVVNRIPPLVRSGLRALVPTFSFEELLGLSIDGLDMRPADRKAIRANRGSLQEQLITLAQDQAEAWGIRVTRIVVGDIDPNDELKKVLQLKAKALLEKVAAVIQTSALVEQAKVILNASNTTPTHELLMQTIETLFRLQNQRTAAERTGDFGQILQGLATKTLVTAAAS